jgi:hypothetical protein
MATLRTVGDHLRVLLAEGKLLRLMLSDLRLLHLRVTKAELAAHVRPAALS